jgi:hypothetical protein
MYRKIALILVLFQVFYTQSLVAQSLKGLWHGYITANGVDVKGFFALYLEDEQQDLLFGRTYLNRPDLLPDAHNILQFIGTRDQKNIKITELKILNELLPADLVTCIKFSTLEYSRKDNADFLTGTWHGYSEDGESCIPGKVILKKHVASDEKFSDPIPDFIKEDIQINKGSKTLFRQTELMKPVIIQVKNATVRFELNDYMKQDDDTVSVYYNRSLILDKIPITNKAKKFNIRLNRHSDLNEFILYAENLGRIPPNTSTLTIIDGKKRHTISIETTKQKSAVIYLRRSQENSAEQK